jgi:hypothetical protein
MANRYTVYNENTQTVIATGRPWPTKDENIQPPGMEDGVHLLLEVTEAKPTIDNMTHKLVEDAVTYDIPNAQAIRSWSAVALTQAEIDERTPAHYETSTGIKMATDLQSQAAFSNMMTLLNEAGMADSEMVMIKDCFGASHAMTLADFRTQAVAYGLHCYTIFHS